MARFYRKSVGLMLGFLVVGLLYSAPVSANTLTTTTLITGGIDGKGAANQRFDNEPGALSADGRFMTFASSTENLVVGDTNKSRDIFVYDRIAKRIERVSVAHNGQQANNDSYAPDISANGRYVAFATRASNLTADNVSGGCSTCINIFVHDRQTKQNTWANRNTLGLRQDAKAGKVALSGDGTAVAFESDSLLGHGDTNNAIDIAVRNLNAQVTRAASVGNDGYTNYGPSTQPDISGDGRYVAFKNNHEIVVRDLQLGENRVVSRASGSHSTPNESSRPNLSDNGRYVVFESTAKLAATDTNGASYVSDIYERDLLTNQVYFISQSSGGVVADGSSFYPSVSGDGRFVTFTSKATNLIMADINSVSDIFVHYRDNGITRLVSRQSHDGAPANGGHSTFPAISQNGKAIGFSSYATNLASAPLSNRGLNFYLFYNPLVEIPYFDGADFMDLLFRR